MNWLKKRSVCFLFAALAIQVSSWSETIEANGRKYAALRPAANPGYNFELTLVPDQKGRKVNQADFLFGYQDSNNYYRVQFLADRASLTVVRNGQVRLLSESTRAFLAGTGTQTVTIKRRRHAVYAEANGTLALHAIDSSFAKGKLCVGTDGIAFDIRAVRYQPVGEVYFKDDFMQAEEKAEDLGRWTALTGHWTIHSVMSDIMANKDARVRPTHMPDPQRSPNPFSLETTGADRSFISTGYKFWDGYAVEASGKTSGGRFGIAFALRDSRNCYLMRWELQSAMQHSGKVELVRIKSGKENVLAEASVRGRTDNWYRLKVSTAGGRLRGWIDNTQLFEVRDGHCTGGKIGLYSEGAEVAFFDDVLVTSVQAIEYDVPELLAGNGSELKGKWKISGEPGRAAISPKRSSSSLYAIGDPAWSGYEFEARAHWGWRTRSIGLACGIDASGNFLLCRLRKENGRGRVELVRSKGGTEEVLASYPTQLTSDRWHSLVIDTSDEGVLKFYDNEALELRVAGLGKVIGRAGLYAEGPGAFEKVRAFGQMVHDWEHTVSRHLYVIDPYMQGWASPRWQWLPTSQQPDEDGHRTFIHKSDFYGQFRVRIPVDSSLRFYFGDDAQHFSGGYVVALELEQAKKQARISVLKGGHEVGQARAPVSFHKGVKEADSTAPPIDNWGVLQVQREGKYLIVRLDGKELIVHREREPIPGLNLAMEAPTDYDFGFVDLSRDHVKDYLFERAPVEWQKIGTWRMINRFACDPRWSNFNGRSKGVAALWNKNEFTGDFTVEFYAGMRMRQEGFQGAGWSYPRVGDINFSFNANGENLFSGYTLIHAAWDRFWTERHTRLYREHTIVAETDKELIPRSREHRPEGRVTDIGWDPGGRAIHGAWYYIKMRRRGKHIECYFDNEKVFEFDDDRPINGKRIALWTQMNSIVVARVKVSYQQVSRGRAIVDTRGKTMPLEPAPAAKPAFTITSASHPSLLADFENSLDGWKPFNGEESARLTLDGSRARGRASLKLTNMHEGGDFGADIPVERVDLSRVAELSFDYRIPRGCKVNLYFATEDDPYTRYFVHLTGDDFSDDVMVKVGDFQARADGKWRHASLDLGRALRARKPWKPQFIARDMSIGNLHEGYLNAGFGGNSVGAAYHLDNFRLIPAGSGEAEFQLTSPKRLGILEYQYLVDTLPDTSPEKSQGALSVTPHDAPAVAPQPAKAVAARAAAKEKDKKEAPPVPEEPKTLATIKSSKLPFGLVYLHVVGKKANGGWTEVVHRPVLVAPTLQVASVGPADGRPWGSGPIRIQFDSKTRADFIPAGASLKVNGQSVRLNEETAAYDPFDKVLSLRLDNSGLTFSNGAEVKFELAYGDNRNSLPGPKAEPGKAAPAPKLAADSTFQWKYSVDVKSDRIAPGKVKVAGRLIDEDFEDGLGTFQKYGGATGAVLSRDNSTAAGGSHSLKIMNPVEGGSSGASILSDRFQVGQFPILAFDYKTDGQMRADFFTVAGGTNRSIAFLDGDTRLTPLGQVPDLKKDNEWHHVDVPLKDFFDTGISSFRTDFYHARQLHLYDYGHRANIPGVELHLDNFSLVPAATTNRGGLKLSWSAHDACGIAAYAWKWSRQPKDEPEIKNASAETSQTFPGLPEGENYFHIRARDTAGNWGPTAHLRYVIDNTAPKITQVRPINGAHSASSTVEIHFDENGSGVDPAVFSLYYNGTRRGLSAAHTKFDPKAGVLSWNWVEAAGAMSNVIRDKTPMTFELRGLSDFVGNRGQDHKWTWQIDYSKDKTAPPPPSIYASRERLLTYSTFSKDLARWTALGARGAELESFWDEGRKDFCLKAVNHVTRGKSAAYIFSSRFDTDKYPLVDFEYKFPPGINLMFRLYTNTQYYCIKLTAESSSHITMGEVPGIVADGQWHRARFNLYDIVKKGLPDNPTAQIYYFAIGNWSNSFNPVGTTYYIDNFTISGESSPEPVFTWSAADSSGIAGYSFAMDKNPLTVPDTKIDSTARTQRMPVLDAPGLYFVHVRAQDGAGNWGPVNRRAYYCMDVPPEAATDGFEAENGWTATAAERNVSVSQHQISTISGKNKILSFNFYNRQKKATSFTVRKAVSWNAAGKKQLELHLLHQDATPIKVWLALKTKSKLGWFDSLPMEVPGGDWAGPLVFRLDSAKFQTLASQGNFNAPLENPEAIQEIKINFQSEQRSGLLMVDGIRFK